jgi:hypothetical protein
MISRNFHPKMHKLSIEVGTVLKRTVLIMADGLPFTTYEPRFIFKPLQKDAIKRQCSEFAYISKLQVIRGPSVQIFRVLTIGSSFTLVGSAFEGRKFK